MSEAWRQITACVRLCWTGCVAPLRLQDASRPVDVAEGDYERAMREMLAAGAHPEILPAFAPLSQS